MSYVLKMTGRTLASTSFLFAVNTAGAQDACGLCQKEITTNADLAKCFLDEYQNLASQTGEAVAVNLNDCEASRGVVPSLPTPNSGSVEPDLEFMVSRAQLDCLKRKLEDPATVLDPSATIALDAC